MTPVKVSHLQQILSSIGEEKLINPVVAVLDDAITKHLRDRLEAIFSTSSNERLCL